MLTDYRDFSLLLLHHDGDHQSIEGPGHYAKANRQYFERVAISSESSQPLSIVPRPHMDFSHIQVLQSTYWQSKLNPNMENGYIIQNTTQ